MSVQQHGMLNAWRDVAPLMLQARRSAGSTCWEGVRVLACGNDGARWVALVGEAVVAKAGHGEAS
jgi:hypothetical protein